MLITLAETAPFFFLPNGQMHLSEENPTTEVEFSSLDKETQRLLLVGLLTRQINSSEPVANLQAIYREIKPVVAEVVPETFALHQEVAPDFLNSELIKLLGKTIGTVKRNIGLTNDIRKLRLMLELEKDNRARNPVITAIQDKLTMLSSEIAANIKNNTVNTTLPVLPEDELVISEEDFHTVSIELPIKVV